MATISGSGNQETPPDDAQLKPSVEKSSTGPRSISPLTHSPIPSQIAKLTSDTTAPTKADLSKKQIMPKNSAEARKEIVEAIENKTIDVAIAILQSNTNFAKEDLFAILHHAYETKSEELIALTIDRGAEPTHSQIEQAVKNGEYGLLAKLIEPLKGKDPRPNLRMEDGRNLIEHCIERNDKKAIHLLKQVTAFEIDTGWEKCPITDIALRHGKLDIFVELLKEQKSLGMPPANSTFPMHDFLKLVKPTNPSKEFLYLVGEQHFGWDKLFSDDMEHQKFLVLFDNPSCNLPEDLRPMVDLCKARGKSKFFCQSCLSIGCNPKGQPFAEKVASLVWEVMQSDPASRALLFDWPTNMLAASLLITHCLDEFLQSEEGKKGDLSTILSESIKRFPESDAKLQKVLEAAIKANTSFAKYGDDSLCVKALKAGYFESYFKMVDAELSKGEVIDFVAQEKFIPPHLKDAYNEAKSKRSHLPENVKNAINALQNGDIAQLRALSKTDLDLKNPLLMKIAVKEGKWEVVQFLLQQGALFTPADFPQQIDVYNYAIYHKLPGLISLLAKQGWNVNQPGTNGKLPLMAALGDDLENLLPIFISLGANINQLDSHGFAPIHYVTHQYDEQALEFFLKLGADPLLPATNGSTAFSIAAQNGGMEYVEILLAKLDVNDARAIDVVKGVASTFDMTAVELAVKTNRLTLAEKLLLQEKQAGVNPNTLPSESVEKILEMLESTHAPEQLLYLIAEQYIGWDQLFSDKDRLEKFLHLFNNPNCKIPEALQPLVEAAHANKKSQDLFTVGMRYCIDASESFRNNIAPLLWNVVNSDPQIRKQLFEQCKKPQFVFFSSSIASQIIVRFCLDDFLKWDGLKDPDVSTLLREAITYLPDDDPRLAKLLDLAAQKMFAFGSPNNNRVCALALEKGRFTLYFKMVEASLNQKEIVDIEANETFVSPDLLALYNLVKSTLSDDLQTTLAIMKGDEAKLSSLAASGIDLKNPLFMRAAIKGGQWKIIQYLVQQGASFTPADYPEQKAVFHEAVNHDLPDLIALLKAQGWDISKPGADGLPVIAYAMSLTNYKTMVPQLVKAGASINASDWQGLAPIHHAIINQYTHGDIQFLIELGADVSRQTSEGKTALHLAFDQQSMPDVKVLLKNGANLHQMTRFGQSPLQEALTSKNPLCKQLIESLFWLYCPANNPLIHTIVDTLLEDIEMQNVPLQQTVATLLAKAQECTNDDERSTCLHLAFLLNDKPTMKAISQKMAPEAFAACCNALEKLYPASAVSILRYCMYATNPEHLQTGAKPQEEKVQEQSVDPKTLREAFVGVPHESALNKLLDSIQNETLASGVEKVAPEALDPAKQAYFDTLRPLQLLNKAERLLILVSDPKKRDALREIVSQAQSGDELHKAYMEVMLYHVEEQFTQINFSDPKKPNYRDPAKLTFMGELKTPQELQENLNRVVTYTKDRTPYIGTPPSATKELEAFYSKLETKLDEFVQELVIHTDPDQQATVLIDLAMETGYCAAKWIQFVSASRDTLRGKIEVLTFEDKFYQALQGFRSGIIQEMVSEANVHEYNHYVSQVGQELNLPDADTFVDYHDIFEDEFMKKEEIRALFDTLNTPERIVAFAKSFLDEEYKKNRDMTVEWFGAHVPQDWPYTVGDYLEEQMFDEDYKLRTTAAVQFLKSLPIPVLSMDQPIPKG